MTNFDAIRTSHLGVMEYLCKDRTPPPELLGLWTLEGGSTRDLSRYAGSCNISFQYTATEDYGFPLITTTIKRSTTFVLGKSLDLSKDWSWEGYFRDPTPRPMSRLNLGPLQFDAGNGDGYNYAYIFDSGTRLTYGGNWTSQANILHRAIQYTASDTTLRVFKNGAIQISAVCDLSDRSAISTFTYTYVGNPFGSDDNVFGIGNIRLVQKALGTSTTFPTPTGLYTGLEPI